MNIIDILRGMNPAAAGAAITGYGAENTPFPMPPPRPPQAAIDVLPPEQNFPVADDAPKGSVLAVIDPALQKRQQEEKGLLAQAAGALTGGGLTADGKGRSKWGAFAHGLSTGLNNAGASRAASEDKAYKRGRDALSDEDRRQGIELRKADSESNREYRNRMAGVAEQRQRWMETPDDPNDPTSDPTGIKAWRDNMAFLRDKRDHQTTLGLNRDLSTSQRVAAQAKLDEWVRNHPYTRRQAERAGAAPATPGATPAPAPAPAGAPTQLPGATAPAPAASAPAPAPAPAAPAIAPGTRARNPQTGAVIQFDGSRWVPAQ